MNISYAKRWLESLAKKTDSPGNITTTDIPREPTDAISIPLYVAGAVVQIAGLAAVSFQLGESSFAFFTIGLTILGTFVSYQLRRAGTPTRLLKSGTFLLGLIFLYALRGAGVFGSLVPPEEVGSQEMLLVSALAFTATFASFVLITDDAIIFTCVWAIAMIGLTGTVNINRELPMCFVVFLAAASFLLVHQNALSFGGSGLAADPKRRATIGPFRVSVPRWPLVRTHLMMAAAAWLTALFLGVLVAIPVQMVGRNMSLGTIIQRLKVPPAPVNRFGGAPRLIFDNPTQFNVGLGPVEDDPTERLSVWTDRPQYWRGRTYDIYTGRGWASSFLDRPPTLEAPAESANREGVYTFELTPQFAADEPRKRTERIKNTFHVSAGTYGPIYHAAEPQLLRAPLFRIFVRPDHTISGGRGMNTDYEMESDVSTARPSDLRRSKMVYPTHIADQYLAVGPYDSDALRALADEAVVGFAGNPYDKASAIRRFVASRCIYTRDARAVPRDRDAAEFFLNESREGYCDLYATSMAILCRYAGLPSRVVTGFAPGLPMEDNNEPKPGGRGDNRSRYVLRGSDQHAWTEVYFSGYGWIVFDATVDTGGTTPVAHTPEPEPKEPTMIGRLWQERMPAVLITCGLLALAFVVANEVRSRAGRVRSGAGPTPADRNAEAVYRTYDGAVRRLHNWGVRRVHAATTGEYLAAVRSTLGTTAVEALEPLTRLTEKALYGPSTVTEEDVSEARAARARLDAVLKQTPKTRPKKDEAHASSAR